MQTLDAQTPVREAIGSELKVSVADPFSVSWNGLVERLDGSSFFHTREWAQVLAETYGHRPVYLAGMEDGSIRSLLPLMEVGSPLTGLRGVSLPFSDFCKTLGNATEIAELWKHAVNEGRSRNWAYLETRNGFKSINSDTSRDGQSIVVLRHVIPLDRDSQMATRLAPSAKRALAKAKAADVTVELASDERSLVAFYRLHCETRRRHGVPPQPFRFFENILRFVLKPGLGFVAIGRIAGKDVAAAMFFNHKKQAIFKFGASSRAFQSCRPNNMVMWEAMRSLNSDGYQSLDLGRTSVKNEGLRRFKLTLGAVEEKVSYCRYDFKRERCVTLKDDAQGWFNRIFRLMPLPLLKLSGNVLYPHLS